MCSWSGEDVVLEAIGEHHDGVVRDRAGDQDFFHFFVSSRGRGERYRAVAGGAHAACVDVDAQRRLGARPDAARDDCGAARAQVFGGREHAARHRLARSRSA